MPRVYVQQKRPGTKAAEPSYRAPSAHAPSLVSGQSSSDLDALMQAKYRQHFLDNQIPTAEAEADRIAASVSGARTPEEVKTQLGEKMGADFSSVTFHTDSAALKQADAMGARAYTSGSDVYFGSGGFDPGVAAHELVHTVQQGMVGSTMGTVSAPTGGVQMKKRADAKKRSRFDSFRNALFGTKNARANKGMGVNTNLLNAEDIADIGGGRAGRKYTGARENWQANGQSVIMFSGSGGSNFEQMSDIITQYVKQGYTVYGSDYRGFGDNMEGQFQKFKPSEGSLNEDAHAIYDYVLANQGEGKNANDIKLHGFSMGGAVAARLAADISESARSNDDKLGGLVLHSAMRDMETEAAETTGGIKGWLAGKLSKLFLGTFNTNDALSDVHAADPTLPVSIVGGGSQDRLGPDKTNLAEHVKGIGMATDDDIFYGSAAHLTTRKTTHKDTSEPISVNHAPGAHVTNAKNKTEGSLIDRLKNLWSSRRTRF